MRFFEGPIAVVGASEKRIAAQIFATLLKQYDDVIPVNPKLESVLGEKCYSSIIDISKPIDTVVMIVNPKIGISILDQVIEKGIKKVWFQPGSESRSLMEFCDENGINYSTGVCLMHG